MCKIVIYNKTGFICHQLRKKEKLRSQDIKEKKEEDAIVIKRNKYFFNLNFLCGITLPNLMLL